jgi:hypothetical protein
LVELIMNARRKFNAERHGLLEGVPTIVVCRYTGCNHYNLVQSPS